MLRSALAALQSRKRAKKNSASSSSEKRLAAPAKLKLPRLKKKGAGGGEIGAVSATAPMSTTAASPSSPSLAAAAATLSVFARARLSALAAAALLAAQAASLLLAFYVSFVRLLLDLPVALASTSARTAAATLLSSRPVSAATSAAARARAKVPPRLSNLLPAPKKKEVPGCVFYECSLHHRRLRPARHEFEYRVRMALVDLDAPPRWFLKMKKTPHLSAAEAREAAGLPASSKAPVWLLTMPPSAGYSQNPISVYYCFAEEEKEENNRNDAFALPPTSPVVAALAEVTNTPWGSVARFSFDPSGDSVPKCLHVSPFMDMKNEWRLTAPAPGQRLALSVAALHPELGAFFSASLIGHLDSKKETRSCLAERSGDLGTFFKYSYGPQRVALWIYGHAAVLLWRKGLSIFGPPEVGAGAKAVKEWESDGDGRSKKRGGLLSSSSSSYSSSSVSINSSSKRWHEWVAAREWPWRVGACGI